MYYSLRMITLNTSPQNFYENIYILCGASDTIQCTLFKVFKVLGVLYYLGWWKKNDKAIFMCYCIATLFYAIPVHSRIITC